MRIHTEVDATEGRWNHFRLGAFTNLGGLVPLRMRWQWGMCWLRRRSSYDRKKIATLEITGSRKKVELTGRREFNRVAPERSTCVVGCRRRSGPTPLRSDGVLR